MLSFFFFFSLSIFWDFSEVEFDEKLKGGAKKPLFAVFYSKNSGNWTKTEKDFANLEKRRKDVDFTIIDCNSTYICKKYKIFSFPKIFFIFSKNRNQWKSANFSDFNATKEFIRENTRLNIKKLAFPLSNVTIKTSDTIFELFVENERNSVLNEIRMHQIQNFRSNNFFYNINSKDEKIRAYITNECYVEEKVNVDNVKKFLDEGQFSAFNEYNDDSIRDTDNNKLILFQKSYSKFYGSLLEKIQNEFCGDVFVGFSNEEVAPEVMKEVNMTVKDLPFFLFYNKDCKAVYKGRPKNLKISNFVEDSINKKTCGSVKFVSFDNVYDSEEESKEKSPSKISGMMFETFYFITGLTLIFFLQVFHKEAKIN